MRVGDIYDIVDEITPFELQDKGDNSGLLIGNKDDEFSKIYLTIDLDLDSIEKIEPNSLVITHHPIIYYELKKLDPKTYPSTLLYKLIKKDIKVISTHLNFDKTHFNTYLVEKLLGYKIAKKEEYEVYFQVGKNFDEFAKEVAQKFNQSYTRVVKTKEFINTAVFCSGAGGSLLKDIKDADCFITGDIKYSTGLEAKAIGINIIEIGHFESESFFAKIMQEELAKKGIDSFMIELQNPFEVIV